MGTYEFESQEERIANCCVSETDLWGRGNIMIWGGISPQPYNTNNHCPRSNTDEMLHTVPILFNNSHCNNLDIVRQNNSYALSAKFTGDFLMQQNIHTLPYMKIKFSPYLSRIT